jgi:hypothetical protein
MASSYTGKPLSKTKLAEIAFRETGATPKEIASAYGLHEKTVARICVMARRSIDIGQAPDLCRKGLYSGFKDIIEPILWKHGFRWCQVLGHNRVSVLRTCRWECWTALNDAGKPYVRIGDFFGRDHTTIWHGCQRYRGLHVEETNASGQAAQRGQEGTGESRNAA